MKIIIATGNKHKVIEFNEKFKSENGVQFIPMDELNTYPADIIEDGSTFEENALIKCRALASYTDEAVIADDSGIVVDALNGEPGIFSARYMGLHSDQERNRAILEKMNGIAAKERSAHFVSVIAFKDKNGKEFTFRGEFHGYIHTEISGEHGFGYDPIFFLPEFDTTVAHITLEQKNSISHRAKALNSFLDFFRKECAK